ncbi:MAG: hypothetical protein IPN60_00015 [Saprospiraceae bacterium]|nr:hypothetical protein [Candidatus Opimibacter skivensis]
MQADFKGWYLPDARNTLDQLNVEINSRGHIYPADLAYFFPESMMMHVRHWDTTQIVLEGNYVKGLGVFKALNLHTGNSQIEASGSVNDILTSEKLQWNNLVLDADIGADFKRTMTPFPGGIHLPPDINFHVTSSGNLRNIALDGKVNSTWGDVKLKGKVMPKGNNLGLDLELTGEGINPAAMMDVHGLAGFDLTSSAKAVLAASRDVAIKGYVSSISVLDHLIHDITFQR